MRAIVPERRLAVDPVHYLPPHRDGHLQQHLKFTGSYRISKPSLVSKFSLALINVTYARRLIPELSGQRLSETTQIDGTLMSQSKARRRLKWQPGEYQEHWTAAAQSIKHLITA